MMKSPALMYAYAAFLIVMSVGASVYSGFASFTTWIPAIMAVPMILFGFMGSMIDRKYVLGMIGIHAGLVFPLLYALMFGRLTWVQFTAEESDYRLILFGTLLAGSLIAFVLILLKRPKPEKRG